MVWGNMHLPIITRLENGYGRTQDNFMTVPQIRTFLEKDSAAVAGKSFDSSNYLSRYGRHYYSQALCYRFIIFSGGRKWNQD